MPYDPVRHHRRSIRLKGFDYSRPGAYFVTVCVQGRECLLGIAVDGEMILNAAGRMVQEAWRAIPRKFPTVDLDAFVVMPNHVHFIVMLTDGGTESAGDIPDVGVDLRVDPAPAGDPDAAPGREIGQARRPAPPTTAGDNRTDVRVDLRVDSAPNPSLPQIVRWFKSLTTAEYRHAVREQGWPAFPSRLWQRNYYERVIRDESELNRARAYINANPACWPDDVDNPERQAAPRR